MVNTRWLDARRVQSFTYGIALRERLLLRYMAEYGSSVRPFLKDVVNDLIEDECCLGARLLHGVLPLDRYAQSELVGTRIVVTVNSRIAEMPGVKHAEGVAYVGKWHEAVHVDGHLRRTCSAIAGEAPMLPLFDETRPRLIVCRSAAWQQHERPEWEFTAENAGLAAAIAEADLDRCESYLELCARASRGGDLGRYAWRLVYDAAERIGANPSALIRYLGYRGVCRVSVEGGTSTIVADPQLFGSVPRLESQAPPAGERNDG